MNDKPSPNRSNGEAVYDVLLRDIREGRVSPGQRLREEDVSERLKMSRTPVREAIRRLEADGIIEHRPRIGAIIRQLSHNEIVELYEMRMVLERTAAEMTAQHGTDAEFDTLEELNADIRRERANPARAAALNHALHQSLYLAGRNQFLVTAAKSLNNSLLLLGPTTFTSEARVSTVVEEHDAIIQALRMRDAKAAGAAAQAHLQNSFRYRLKALST